MDGGDDAPDHGLNDPSNTQPCASDDVPWASALLPRSVKKKPDSKKKLWCDYHGYCRHATSTCDAPERKRPQTGDEKALKFSDMMKGYMQKKSEATHKCPTCWHACGRCICHIIKPLDFTIDVSFIVYVHYSEYLSGGDDAKLMQLAAPDRTKLLVYGREGDDDILLSEVAKNPHGTFLLYPSATAISVDDFKALQARQSGTGTLVSSLTLIVLDATWARTRSMCRHFNKMLKLDIPHIQLQPTTLSVYARKQSQPDRICTLEAISLLLQELGEQQAVCDALVAAVRINNSALQAHVKLVAVMEECQRIQDATDEAFGREPQKRALSTGEGGSGSDHGRA